jgi:hypothetical protein
MSVNFPTEEAAPKQDTQIPDNPRGRSCLTCVFIGVEGTSTMNCCKFYPPIRQPNGQSHWPGVHGDDWCGQYKGPAM